jgi:hypothetical protein
VPTSALPAKSVCICQPVRSFGSVINVYAPDAAQAVASMSPAKSVCIGQPARSSGSVIDLSAPDAVQAVASASLLAKPVFIHQPAPGSSGSVIDLSTPDAALASASASPEKPVFGLSSGIVNEIAGIDVVKENRVLTDNHALAIVVGQMKSREQEAAHRCRELEESRDWL